MREYQDADYRSIYTDPIAVPGIGDCWLVAFIEPTNEYDADRPEGESWTALFLVSPALAGPATVKDCLEATVGYKGEPTPEEAAVGLAEFGKRITLWEKTSEEGEADLEAAQAEAARLLANPALLSKIGTGLQCHFREEQGMTITLLVKQSGEDDYIIGTVTAPTTIPDDQVDAALEQLWEEWREEEPTPDADSEFVTWLVGKGWREVESYGQHTFFT